MVSTQEEEVLWVLDLVSKEKAYRFERLLASVNIVTKEQVIALRRKSTILEQSQEIIVLPVNVPFHAEIAKRFSGVRYRDKAS